MNTSGHVFLSYSRHDSHMVDRIRHTLERAGIPVWLDTQELSPGTPNWEQAVTQAIDLSFAFILIASPSAKTSPYVQGEIAFAEANNKPIFPIWVAGDNWSRTVPLHLIRSQYVDARGEGYNLALQQIIAELVALTADLVSKNIENKELDYESHVPEGHIEVIDPLNSTILLEMSSVPLINDVIMQCYLRVAYKFVGPYSYGTEWLLVQTVFNPLWETGYPVFRAAMGWELFANVVRGSNESNSLRYVMKESSHAGFIPGTRWRIILQKDFRLIGSAGIRRDMLFPGMVPEKFLINSVETMLKSIDKVRDETVDYLSYIEKTTRTVKKSSPVKSFRPSQYMEDFDFFILQDVNNRLADFHGTVIQFNRK